MRPHFKISWPSASPLAASVLLGLLMTVSPAVAAPAKVGELKSDNLTISVSGGSAEQFDIVVSSKGRPIEGPEIFTLDNPPRLVIDLPKVEVKGSKKAELTNSRITGIRLGVHPGKARIVFDLGSATVPAFVVSEGSGSKPLSVRIDFAVEGSAGTAALPAGSNTKIDLSDLPKPDSESEAVAAVKAPSNSETKSPPITAPKDSAEVERGERIDTGSELTPADEELDKSLRELASNSGKLKPAPENLGEDFRDLPPEPAPDKAGAAETNRKKPEQSAKSAAAASEGEELSDEEALKMLELAGDAVKKPEPKSEAGDLERKLPDNHPALAKSKIEEPPVEKVSAEKGSAEKAAAGQKGELEKGAAGKDKAPISERTLADLAAEPSAKKISPESNAVEPEEGSPEQLAKLLTEENGTPEKDQPASQGTTGQGSAVVKGIFYRAADEGKTSAVVIEIGNLNNYSLSQKKKNLYELTIDQASMAGEHVAYPQFPPDTFQGFEAVLAEQQGGTVIIKLYVAEGTKLSPFRVKDQLWVKVLK